MLLSALNREKWERDDYLPRTILNAASKQTEFYDKKYKSTPVCELGQIDVTIQKGEYPDSYPTQNGAKVLNTLGNLQYMLDRLGIVVRWNDMSRTREVTIPNSPIFYDDQENSALNKIINLAILNNLPYTRIDENLTLLAQANHYHPIAECITSKPWDDIPRLDNHIKTLQTTDDEFAYILIRTWMLSAIAAVFSEQGFVSQGALVLQGKQGKGKTFWVTSLDPCNCNAVKSGGLLDPTNKDSLITHASYWIVELGELDGTFKKADMARIKSHITNNVDTVRTPYARKNSHFVRRHVYIATVNETRFLIDDTGNRRWWTAEVLNVDLEYLKGLKDKPGHMQQVWAEVYHLWCNGEKPELADEALKRLNESNIAHEQIDPFEEKAIGHFDWSSPLRNQEMTATDVLTKIGYDKPSRSDSTRMGKILTKLTGLKPRKRNLGNYYLMPPSKISQPIYSAKEGT
jgi:putative DNA primase/helicase